MKKLLYLSLALLFTFCLFGKSYFEWTPQTKDAYDDVMSLRFAEAKIKINQLKKAEPQNLMVHHVEDYMDFLRCYINEDKVEFARLEKNKKKRLSLFESGDENSPYYLYLQASTRLHWAMARLKFDEYFTAFGEVNKAFKLLTRNSKKYPNFMPNKKDLGIMHAMVGTIPDNYKWGVEMLTSLSGTLDQGRGEIKEVLQHARTGNFPYELETKVIYCYMLLYLENDAEEAWKMLQSSNLDESANPLAAFIKGNVAMRIGKNDEAIAALNNKPTSVEYHPFPYLDFMLGMAKLRRLDKDADKYFLKYVKKFKGRHFQKEAYQKLSWHALINGDNQSYYQYKQKVKSEGYASTGSDKSALKEAKSSRVPNAGLLRARLLFDGGYFQKAYDELKSKNSDQFADKQTKLEFTYRMGRILHKLKRYPSAINFYQRTIEKGEHEEWYFACNSALQLGLLFEEIDNFAQAKTYFKICTDIYPSEHKTGLHQQAKAGLGRVK